MIIQNEDQSQHACNNHDHEFMFMQNIMYWFVLLQAALLFCAKKEPLSEILEPFATVFLGIEILK